MSTSNCRLTLCTRLYTKLAAHTLCIYLNRLLGNANFLPSRGWRSQRDRAHSPRPI
jgi:hypothetical protein